MRRKTAQGFPQKHTPSRWFGNSILNLVMIWDPKLPLHPLQIVGTRALFPSRHPPPFPFLSFCTDGGGLLPSMSRMASAAEALLPFDSTLSTFVCPVGVISYIFVDFSPKKSTNPTFLCVFFCVFLLILCIFFQGRASHPPPCMRLFPF